MSGNTIGLVLSIVVVLGLSVSMYWAATEKVIDTTTVTEVYTTEQKVVPNLIQASPVLTSETAASWGTIPGNFNSTYNSKL